MSQCIEQKRKDNHLRKAIYHYKRVVFDELPIRELARQTGCHASTILRQIRNVENLLESEQVQSLLGQMQGNTHVSKTSNRPELMYVDQLTETETACLDLLAQPHSVLVMAENLTTSVIVIEDAQNGPTQNGTIATENAQSLAMRGCLNRISSGRIAKFVKADPSTSHPDISSQTPTKFTPHVVQGQGDLDTEQHSPRNYAQELPLEILSRRKESDGHNFLSREDIAAAYRLREDFKLAIHIADHKIPWEEFILKAHEDDDRRFSPLDPLDRTAFALKTLGRGLRDITLRCCCNDKGIETAEKDLGWAARSGKIVLRIALQRLHIHYETVYGKGGGLIG